MKATIIGVLVLVSSTAFGFGGHHHGHHHHSSHHSSSSSSHGLDFEGACLKWAEVGVEAAPDAGSAPAQSPMVQDPQNDGGVIESEHFLDDRAVEGFELADTEDEGDAGEEDGGAEAPADAGRRVVVSVKPRVCVERAPVVGCNAAPGSSVVALFALAGLLTLSKRRAVHLPNANS